MVRLALAEDHNKKWPDQWSALESYKALFACFFRVQSDRSRQKPKGEFKKSASNKLGAKSAFENCPKRAKICKLHCSQCKMVTQNRARARCSWVPLIMIGCFCGLLVYSFYFLMFANSNNDREYSMRLTAKYSVEEMQKFAERNLLTIDYKPTLYSRNSVSFNRLVNNSAATFDVDENDVLVFLHIQKTAGTSFEKFLVYNLNITRPCLCNQTIKRCKCYRPRTSQEFWLFSRYSTGWKCGLHADWTELSNCVERAMDDVESGSGMLEFKFWVEFR